MRNVKNTFWIYHGGKVISHLSSEENEYSYAYSHLESHSQFMGITSISGTFNKEKILHVKAFKMCCNFGGQKA